MVAHSSPFFFSLNFTLLFYLLSPLSSNLLSSISPQHTPTSDSGMVAFAAFSFAMALFGFLAMPETKGEGCVSVCVCACVPVCLHVCVFCNKTLCDITSLFTALQTNSYIDLLCFDINPTLIS